MSGMQILSLEMKNYRQYQNTNGIDLECSPDAMINVIEGENGAGKSNLLNAVTFCFFGTEEHKENNVTDDDAELPLVNSNIIGDLENEEGADGYVEIELGIDEPQYVFRREFQSFKINENEHSDVIEDLSIMKREGSEWITVDAPERTRNEILPPNVREYFIFDAESLRDFFGERYQQRIKNGLLDVSHIELLDRSIYHLRQVRSEMEREVSGDEGKPAELKSKIDSKEEELEELNSTIDDLDNDLEETRRQLSLTEAEMQDASDERVQDLYDQREQLEKQQERLRGELDKVTGRTSELIVENGPLIYAHQAIEYGYNVLEKMDLPPDIRKEYLDELIEDERCICGEDLSNQPNKLERLKDLRVNVATVGESDIKGEYELDSLMNDREEFIADLKANRQEIGEKQSQLKSLNRSLREVSEKLRTFDIPEDIDVAALEDQRKELKDAIESIIKESGKLEAKREEMEGNLENLRDEHLEELNKREEYRKTVAQLKFIDETIEEQQRVREKILSRVRSQVVENMKKYFNELIWKSQEFKIEMADDYSIAVRNDQNQNVLGSLSAGETQVLALSFLAAVSQISGFQAPILIDTPLARISGRPKNQIASNLPNYLEDKQVTFLMTDEEYTAEFEGLLKPSISNEYELHFEDGRTTVVEQ